MKQFITTNMNSHISDNDSKQIVENAVADLVSYIVQFLPNVNITLVQKALDFSITAHEGQKRASGLPYIVHPIEVAMILAELHLDTLTIVCALLHDVVEDTHHTIQDIRREFGDQASVIIEGLTKIHKIECQNFIAEKSENLRKLLIAVAKDARVLLIKLADRLHNMRTLSCIGDHRKQMRIAKDTIDIYAPLAERIGVHFFKNILYDLSFDVLYPQVRKSIIDQVNILKEQGEHNIHNIVNEITELIQNHKINVDIKGREKTPFSIWQKMEKKKVYFDDLSDIFAVRIITKTPLDCYIVLGIIHTNYRVLSKEFFDYVSTPKQNGYMSIHTVVMFSNSTKVEVQIRTTEMHYISELGMAAHWIYKNDDEEVKAEYQEEWLKKIRSIMENIADTNDILANVKLEMAYDQVFCFTPNGDVISLPKNATPLDFAFEVNVNLGAHYSKALVNGKNVSMTTILNSGDQVEILTSDQITIHHNWLNIVCTSKAKAEIQVYLEKKLFESIIMSGNLSFHDECEKYHLNINHDKLRKFADSCNVNIDELLYNIGSGALDPQHIVRQISQNSMYDTLSHFVKTKVLSGDEENKSQRTLSNFKQSAEIQFGYCCNPVFGGVAVGIYNPKTKVVVIHASSCHNINKCEPEEEIYNIILSDVIYNVNNVKMEILVSDYVISASIFDVFTEFGMSKYTIEVKQIEKNLIELNIDLKLVIPHQLESLISKIRNLSGVINVSMV